MSHLWTADDAGARSDAAILEDLGRRLARERLRLNLTQEELAERAGVSRATVRRLEAGSSTQLANLVRLLRALGLVDRLRLVVDAPPVRPLVELEDERRGRERRRASGTRAAESSGGAATSEPGPWRWGEDR